MERFLLLVQLGVAAWMVYEAIRAVTPVYPQLQPVLVAAICYGLTFAPPIVLLVLNASALVALIRMLMAYTAIPRRITGAESGIRPRRTATRDSTSGRIPRLP